MKEASRTKYDALTCKLHTPFIQDAQQNASHRTHFKPEEVTPVFFCAQFLVFLLMYPETQDVQLQS